jgi:hypothetical protein
LKLDDRADHAAADARQTMQTIGTPPVAVIAATAQHQTRLRYTAVTFAAVVLVIAAVGLSALVTRDHPGPAVTDTTVASQSTTTVVTTDSIIPVLPALDAASAASLEVLPYPGATVFTQETLTDQIVNDLRTAIVAIDQDEDPTQIIAAFERNGVVYATATDLSGRSALIVEENGEVLRFRSGTNPWTDVHETQKASATYTQITWVGLPEDAATVHLVTPSRLDIQDQRPMGSTAFFEIMKLPWTQIGTLTAYDNTGTAILTDEVRIPGWGCSVGGLPGPDANMDLPEPVAARRDALASAVHVCLSLQIANQATGDGPYFDMPFSDPQDTQGLNELAAALRDANMRTGLFRPMALALSVEPTVTEGDEGPIYIFSWADEDNARRIELGFTQDGTWQYGIYTNP